MKTRNSRITATLASLIFVLLSIVLLSTGASGQGRINKYVTTTPTLTWTDLPSNGGSLIYNGELHYGMTTSTSLPFAFNYDNTSVSAGSTVYLSGGWVSFSGQPSYVDYGGVANSSYPEVLAFFGGPYMVEGTSDSYGGYAPDYYGIYTKTTGSSPNRVFTVQLQNCHSQGGAGAEGMNTMSSVQVKLYETTGVIQFLYQYHDHGICGYNYYNQAIGLNGFTSPSFQSLTYTKGIYNTPSTDLQFAPPPPPAQLSLQPKSLNYGGVGTGSSLTLNDTVRSVGSANLVINTATITGSADFSIFSGPANGTSLPPGTFAVYALKFTPTANGSLSATFTVNSSGADSAVQSCLLNGSGMAPSVVYTFPYNGAYPNNTLFHHVSRRFGDTAVQYFYMQNTGQVPMVINSIYFIGLQSSMYTLVHVPTSPMAGGQLDSIGVKFRPYLEGRPDAQLVISTNAINIPFDTVSMWGVGVLGHLVVTPSHGSGNTLTFDSVAIGDSVCASITLHNTGSDTVKITRQIVTYGDYDYTFYLLKGSDLTLPPDASKIVNVCFVPIARGGRFASIRFYTNIPPTYPDNRDTSQFLINVTGTGVPYGILSLAGNPSDSALIDSTKCANATIKNMGLSELTVTSTTITGAGASDFTISGVTMPFTLAPGASIPVTLCFKAATRGPEAVTLTVNGTTSGRPLTQSIPLLGVGLTACLDAAPSPITFGSTALPGKTIAKTGHDTTCVTVTNCGDVPVTYTAAFTPGTNGGYHVLGSLMTPVVAPNGTTTICIEYDADTIGPAGGSVVVSASERAAAPKTLALAGVGAGVVIAGSADGGLVGLTKCDTFSVTINNTGNVDWTPGSSIGTTGTNASDFTPIGTTNPATIPAGGSGTIMVIFCPTTGSAETADLTFPNAAPLPLSGTVTLGGLGSSAGVAQQTEKDGFTLGATYPNPTNGKADVIVTLPHEAQVTIALTNLAGAVVRTVYTGTLSSGMNIVSLDAGDLASGTYFYMLTSGTIQLTREMMIVR